MTPSARACTSPGQVHQLVAELEATVRAEFPGHPAPAEDGGVQGDWVPEVPGAAEPPD